jgi:ankyrin repeat protein
MLIQRNTKINQHCKAGRSPLSYAARKGHWLVIKHLLGEKEIDVNMADNEGKTALHEVYLSWEDTMHQMLKLLLAEPALNINTKDHNGKTPLY